MPIPPVRTRPTPEIRRAPPPTVPDDKQTTDSGDRYEKMVDQPLSVRIVSPTADGVGRYQLQYNIYRGVLKGNGITPNQAALELMAGRYVDDLWEPYSETGRGGQWPGLFPATKKIEVNGRSVDGYGFKFSRRYQASIIKRHESAVAEVRANKIPSLKGKPTSARMRLAIERAWDKGYFNQAFKDRIGAVTKEEFATSLMMGIAAKGATKLGSRAVPMVGQALFLADAIEIYGITERFAYLSSRARSYEELDPAAKFVAREVSNLVVSEAVSTVGRAPLAAKNTYRAKQKYDPKTDITPTDRATDKIYVAPPIQSKPKRTALNTPKKRRGQVPGQKFLTKEEAFLKSIDKKYPARNSGGVGSTASKQNGRVRQTKVEPFEKRQARNSKDARQQSNNLADSWDKSGYKDAADKLRRTTQLTDDQLAALGPGPYPLEFFRLAALHPPLLELTKSDPTRAKAIYQALSFKQSEDLHHLLSGKSAYEVRRVADQLALEQPTTTKFEDFTLYEAPKGSVDQPAGVVLHDKDSNGGFNRHSKFDPKTNSLKGASNLRRPPAFRTGMVLEDGTVIRPRQMVVTGGHGNHRSIGDSNKNTARATAKALKNLNTKRRPDDLVDTVYLESCSQADRSAFGATNAQRFAKELEKQIGYRVQVVAADKPGMTMTQDGRAKIFDSGRLVRPTRVENQSTGRTPAEQLLLQELPAAHSGGVLLRILYDQPTEDENR